MATVFSPFLGKGAKYPFTFDSITGGVKRSSSEEYNVGAPVIRGTQLDKINGSLHHILTTPLGSRLFLPDFGSNLYRLVFEPNNDVFSGMARVYISDAISKWEKRIIILTIDILTNTADRINHTAKININYRVISTQITGNYVYPFVRSI